MGKSKDQKLKDFLFDQYKKGNLVWKKKKIDKRKITGQREPKNITDAALILFFVHFLDKWTIRGAIKSAMKTPDFKIIFNKKLESLKNNPKRKNIQKPLGWFERIVYREYPGGEDELQRKYIEQYGPLMKFLQKAKSKRNKDGKMDFYPGSY